MGSKLSGPGGQGGKTIEQNADINVTPFVDIMLVLLIIFMVSAPLATVSIKLDLPPATPPPPGKQEEPVYISIQNETEIFISNGGVPRPTNMANLAPDVCAALGGGSPACQDKRVFIRAQPEVPYDTFMTVMNTLQSKGFKKVGLLNEDIQ